MRVFLAAEPDPTVSLQLDLASAQLRGAAGHLASRWRWASVDHLHLTLHFLGEVSEAAYASVVKVLAQPFDVPAFTAVLGELGTFPSDGPARVVWLAPRRGTRELTALHAVVGDRLMAAGSTIERRAFTPHVTMARGRDVTAAESREFRRRLAAIPMLEVVWQIRGVVLVQSDLSAGRRRYTTRGRWPLAPLSTEESPRSRIVRLK